MVPNMNDEINISHNEAIHSSIDKFWDVIPPVWREVRKYIHDQAVESYQITLAQFHILRHIRHGRDSVSELAKTGKISRPAISRAVDVLVNKGLVARSQNPEDRRNVQLSLTEDGQELIDELFSKTHRWMSEKLTMLTENELKSILRAGDALKKAFIEINSK
jgi:DNA-binding MarR family transcriptional regulator